MAGAGFTQDMIKSTNDNRALVKGSGGTYSSFDSRSYGFPTKKKEAKFKEASPEVLAEIRANLEAQNKQSLRKKRTIILLATVFAVCCIAAIFLIKF